MLPVKTYSAIYLCDDDMNKCYRDDWPWITLVDGVWHNKFGSPMSREEAAVFIRAMKKTLLEGTELGYSRDADSDVMHEHWCFALEVREHPAGECIKCPWICNPKAASLMSKDADFGWSKGKFYQWGEQWMDLTKKKEAD